MRTRRKQKKQKQQAKTSRGQSPEGIFPGLEQLQAAEQEERDNYCIETEYRLSDREWRALVETYNDCLRNEETHAAITRVASKLPK